MKGVRGLSAGGWRLWFGRIALMIGAALVSLEIAARVVVALRTPTGLVFDDDAVFRFRPRATVYGLELNNLGALGDDVQADTPDVLSVFLFGGSTSYSRQYVDTVRRHLRRLCRCPVRVTSFGRPRYTSYNNMVIASEVIAKYHPDVVVLYLGINDNIYNTFPWVENKPDVGYFNWKDPTSSMLIKMCWYHLVEKRLLSTPDFPHAPLRSVPLLRRNVTRIINLATEGGAKVVLAEFATAMPTVDGELQRRVNSDERTMEHFWGTIKSTEVGVEAHNAEIRAIAATRGLVVADVNGAVPKNSAYFADMCHLTPAGNEILGTTIGDAVAKVIGCVVAAASASRESAPRSTRSGAADDRP